MKLFALTALVMVAFAANSVLNRAALTDNLIDPLAFALIRTLSGAAMLAALILARDRALSLRGPYRLTGVASLTLYMLAFSLAYLSLDAGLGALILFGGVQVTMFAGALISGEQVPPARWAGAALAFSGLAWLLWPGGAQEISQIHGLLMLSAALGWGIYSLVGRRSGEPLRATAANFILAVPLCLLAFLALPTAVPASLPGMALAVASGALASALGYALWYSVLPHLAASVAAVAQLTVPLIALAGGLLFLGETATWTFLGAAALVLGGVALSVLAPQRTRGSSGS